MLTKADSPTTPDVARITRPAPLVLRGATIFAGDALTVLRRLPSESVRCIVTSPPYWGLRDYGYDEQIGLEATLSQFLHPDYVALAALRLQGQNSNVIKIAAT